LISLIIWPFYVVTICKLYLDMYKDRHEVINTYREVLKNTFSRKRTLHQCFKTILEILVGIFIIVYLGSPLIGLNIVLASFTSLHLILALKAYAYRHNIFPT